MIGKDKILFFMQEKIKIHITMKPTSRFPNGKFYNGFIKEIVDKDNPNLLYFKFLDDVEGLLRLFPEDIDDMEEFKEKFKGSSYQL